MKAVVAAFNQEKALVGAFSVIVKTSCGTDGSICGTTQVPLAQHVRAVAHILQVAGQQLHVCGQPVGGALPEAPLETEPE